MKKGGWPSLQNLRTRSGSSRGFTIIETLIVLAVTGTLFIAFTSAIAGRQDKVRFNQSIRAAKSEIEQVITETQTGYFPDLGNFRCFLTGPANARSVQVVPGNPNEQGTNKECVFLGKALQFGSGLGADPESVGVYALAGSREATDFSESAATVVNQLNDEIRLQYGLHVKWVRYGAGNTNIGAVALVSYFANQDGFTRGSQSTQIVPIDGTDITSADEDRINDNIIASFTNRNPSGGVRVCLVSGTTEQSGLITIGASGSMNSVKLDISNNTDCT